MRRNSFVQAALTGRLGVRLSGGGAAVSLDADAATLIAAMTTAPDATRQGHINTLITGLKADGVWAELDELWVMAAHAEQAALLGWKRAKDLTAVNAPTFTANQGFAGNGSTSYLNTNFVPSTDGVQYTLNDASLGVYSRTTGDQSIDMGSRYGAADRRATVNIRTVGVQHAAVNSDVLSDATSGSGAGFGVSRRSDSANQQAFLNGVELANFSVASSSVNDLALYIGCANNAGNPGFFSTRQYAAAFVGASMSDTQQLALYNRLQTYMTAVGANV